MTTLIFVGIFSCTDCLEVWYCFKMFNSEGLKTYINAFLVLYYLRGKEYLRSWNVLVVENLSRDIYLKNIIGCQN